MGNAIADTISLTNSADHQSFTVDINNNASLQQTFNYSDVTSVRVVAGDGDDFVYNTLLMDTEIFGQNGNDHLEGGWANDLVMGGNGIDILVGRNGDDVLNGQDGDDWLFGGPGVDDLSGITGNDNLYGGTGDDTLNGHGGNDSLWGEDGDDSLLGGADNDLLRGEDGNDTISGGGGDDWLVGGNGDDTLHGDAGNDELLGQNGNDILNGGVDDDILYGASGDDTLRGDTGNDQLYGSAGNDLLYGGDGNDTLSGDGGADSLWGEAGDDSLLGGADNDLLRGEDGNDTISGGGGDDWLVGADGDDTLNGDAGADELLGQNGNDILNGGADDDLLYGGLGNDNLSGNDGDDSIFGNQGNDVLLGYEGDDTLRGGAGVDFLFGNGGADELYGDAGDDVLEAGNDQSADILTGGSGLDQFVVIGDIGSGSVDTVTDRAWFETYNGYSGQLTALAEVDGDTLRVRGMPGDDNIQIYARDGQDSFELRSENQILGTYSTAQISAVVIDSGSGNDLIKNNNRSIIRMLVDGGDGDDYIYGGRGNDLLLGGNGVDHIWGHDGEDELSGGAGDDWIYGGDDDDELNGDAGNDYLRGQSDDDTLRGGDGNDDLFGGTSNDLLFGDAGADDLWGDSGADQFFVDDQDDVKDQHDSSGDTVVSASTASIGDLVFEDTDGDGVVDTGEIGISNVVVTLFSGATEIATQTTDSDGLYSFESLPVGDYRVELTTDLTLDYNITTAISIDVTLGDGQMNDSVDFGAKALPPGTGSIGDLVYEDINGNGMFDSNEAGIEDATVRLFHGSTLIAETNTNSAGQYLFTQLRAGNYRVELLSESLDPQLSYSESSIDVVLADGGNDDEVDFGRDPIEVERRAFLLDLSEAELLEMASILSTVDIVETSSFTIIDVDDVKLAFKRTGDLYRLFGEFPGELTASQVEQSFGNSSSFASTDYFTSGFTTFHTATASSLGTGFPSGSKVVVASNLEQNVAVATVPTTSGSSAVSFINSPPPVPRVSFGSTFMSPTIVRTIDRFHNQAIAANAKANAEARFQAAQRRLRNAWTSRLNALDLANSGSPFWHDIGAPAYIQKLINAVNQANITIGGIPADVGQSASVNVLQNSLIPFTPPEIRTSGTIASIPLELLVHESVHVLNSFDPLTFTGNIDRDERFGWGVGSLLAGSGFDTFTKRFKKFETTIAGPALGNADMIQAAWQNLWFDLNNDGAAGLSTTLLRTPYEFSRVGGFLKYAIPGITGPEWVDIQDITRLSISEISLRSVYTGVTAVLLDEPVGIDPAFA